MSEKYLLILFYSASGAVKNLAHAIADGAEDLGMEVRIRTVPKVSSNSEASEPSIPKEGEVYCTKEDLIYCSGLALGSTGDLWATNALEGIPGCAFTSTGSMHGGQEVTLLNLLTYQLHHGMVILGSPYSIDELNKTKSGGSPYGPSHVESFNSSSTLTPDEYQIAFKTGKRMAAVIGKLNA